MSLIAFEGIDGAGKSTWIALMEKILNPDKVLLTREPTGSDVGQLCRRAIEYDDPLPAAFFFAADHRGHIESTIKPALAENKLVISDRYLHSHLAYQGATLDGVIPCSLQYLKDLYRPWTMAPDVVIYLDLPVDVALARNAKVSSYDENKTLLEKVRANYHMLKKLDRASTIWITVDATKPVEVMLPKILGLLNLNPYLLPAHITHPVAQPGGVPVPP